MKPPKANSIQSSQAPKNKQKKSPYIQVWLSAEEKAAISQSAKAHAKTSSSYLRALGLGYPVKSRLDHESVLELIKISADQGRLGGLLKLWLTNPEKVFDFERIKALLAEIEALQKTLAEKVDNFMEKL